MQSRIINYLPENSKPLPINFHTVSSFYKQSSICRPYGQKLFHQILFILEGAGEVKCGGKRYELKKGSAFFSSKKIPIEYTNNGGLISAFLTADGPAIEALCEYYGYGDFFFIEHVNLDKYISKIEQIISEYYEKKRESVLSGMVYSFYLDFFEENREPYIDLIDRIALYIEKNYTEKLSLDMLAEKFGISVSTLCHDFKRKFGCTVFEHILNLRLTYARNYLLTVPSSTSTDAARSCGFEDICYFCRAYKKKFGKSPLKDRDSTQMFSDGGDGGDDAR